jgi:hypothetical protein
MTLGWLGKRRLRRDGYVLERGAVPPDRVAAALRIINHSLGEEGLPREKLREMRSRTYCPELISAPEILDLFSATAARGLVESTVGAVETPSQGQIALRFPQPRPLPAIFPHIDGIPSADNGVTPGTLYHFTALLGVFLSDVPTADAGNFTVWPGSHETMAAHFRAHGPDSVIGGFPQIPLPQPRPLTGHAGDVVLAHYALAHAVSGNASPHVRYAVFFRIFHQGHAASGTRALTEPWFEWEGMR